MGPNQASGCADWCADLHAPALCTYLQVAQPYCLCTQVLLPLMLTPLSSGHPVQRNEPTLTRVSGAVHRSCRRRWQHRAAVVPSRRVSWRRSQLGHRAQPDCQPAHLRSRWQQVNRRAVTVHAVQACSNAMLQPCEPCEPAWLVCQSNTCRLDDGGWHLAHLAQCWIARGIWYAAPGVIAVSQAICVLQLHLHGSVA